MISRWAERYDGLAFLGGVALIALLTVTGSTPGPSLTITLLAIGVVLFGLPHGALDVSVAKNVLQSKNVLAIGSFFLLYLAIALSYALFWYWSPSLGLLSFLCISALHFSTDWQRRGVLATRLAYGIALVTLPAITHGQQVQTIFLALGTPSAGELVQLSRSVAVPSVVIGLVAACLQWRVRRRDLVEFIALTLSGLFLPPLLYFFCYFCLLHSPRHLFETAKDQGMTRIKEIAFAAAPATLVTVAASYIIYSRLPTLAYQVALIRLTFIGLAALTVPHMLLTFVHATSARRERVAALPLAG